MIGATYNAFQPNESYQYDANGNRKNTGYVTGTNNRLTSDGTFNYTYDGEGNRLTKTRISSAAADDYKTEYVWDHRNRLTSVIQKDNANTTKRTTTMAYDYLNRLTLRDTYTSGNIREVFVHDGWQISHYFVAGTTGNLAMSNMSRRYLWGASQDELIADERYFLTALNEFVLWVLPDHLGSVRDLLKLNSSGVVSVANHIQYDAFGNVTQRLSSTGTDCSQFGYTAKMFYQPIGLQWNINRWYDDAAVGRWLSEDPIIDDFNSYRYVQNTPSNT
ncbi:MAG: hypothetical protein FWD31_10735 [Planctomycetaceae bacterium]|nr:hypothetical protein [Planctomycetaceae bacterium]